MEKDLVMAREKEKEKAVGQNTFVVLDLARRNQKS
jgi:hypothetical protein